MNVDGRLVVVLTALDLEYQAVRMHLTGLQKRPHSAGTVFEVGHLGDGEARIAIGLTGEGNPGAAVLVERAITMFQPQVLLFVGVAGGLKNDINIGDVVVATKVYSYHGGKDEDDGFLARPRAWEAPHELDQLARYIARTDSWTKLLTPDHLKQPPTVHFKPIAAGEVLLNSRDTSLAQQLRHTYNDAAAIEMESAGVSQAAHLNRSLPVLTVRGISDKADGLKHATDQAGWQPTAAAHAAAFALTLAAEILNRGAGKSGASGAESGRYQPGGTQNVITHAGGIAYSVHEGNMYVNPPTAPGQPSGQSSTRADSGARLAGHTSRTRGIAWRPLAEPIDVTWRSDLTRSTGGYERAALELHLVPIDGLERLEVRWLQPFANELALLGRSHKLFSMIEQLQADSSDRTAWATSTDYRSGPAGLAVQRTGQRSAWNPLPHDTLGAILDPDDLVEQITQLLVLLTAIDAPTATKIAPAVGVEPASMISEGQVSAMPRSRAVGYRQTPHIRIPADDTLPYQDLLDHSSDVAEELTARLLAKFREGRR